VDTTRIPPAGDPFTAKPPSVRPSELHHLEEKLAHEIMDDEERMRLRDRIRRLRGDEGR
jgi:hypothetical protein